MSLGSTLTRMYFNDYIEVTRLRENLLITNVSSTYIIVRFELSMLCFCGPSLHWLPLVLHFFVKEEVALMDESFFPNFWWLGNVYFQVVKPEQRF